jgi:TPR repeat protein
MSEDQKSRCVMCRTKYPDDNKEGRKESIQRLRKWAKKGKAWAQAMLFNLGNMYRDGQGVDKDEKRAVELYTMAADQDHAGAQCNLGVMYANGQGVDRSLTTAREWLTKAAAHGHENAIKSLKQLDAIEGRTTTPSSTSSTVNSNSIFCSYCKKPEPTNTKFNRCQRCRSVFYCNRECQMKHWIDKPNGHKQKCKKLKALLELKKEENQMNKNVITDEIDKKETATTTTTPSPPPPTTPPTITTHQQQKKKEEKKEEEECSICLDALKTDGSAYMRATCCGKGMHTKCREDMIASKMSQEQKGRCVMCRTEYPDNTKEGWKEELERLCKWVKKGKAWAQNMLGCRYSKGDGVDKDDKRALELYTLAADQGHSTAQFNLGNMYTEGRGVDKDENRAVELYTLAADQGHCVAQYNLGVMYVDGRGVDKDKKRAVELLTLASEQGMADAQFDLGVMYASGEGVDKDNKRAVELYTLAADQGYANAQYNLGVMYANGWGVDQDDKRAFELYTLAADQSHADAQFNLGCMCAKGKGVNQSITKAREWLTKAAAQGYENAINTLKKLDKAEGRTTTPSSTSSTVNSNTTFCSYCNKPEPTNTKFNKCKGCRSVSYCNRECQIKHWKTKPNGHKKQCKKLAAALKAVNKKNEK